MTMNQQQQATVSSTTPAYSAPPPGPQPSFQHQQPYPPEHHQHQQQQNQNHHNQHVTASVLDTLTPSPTVIARPRSAHDHTASLLSLPVPTAAGASSPSLLTDHYLATTTNARTASISPRASPSVSNNRGLQSTRSPLRRGGLRGPPAQSDGDPKVWPAPPRPDVATDVRPSPLGYELWLGRLLLTEFPAGYAVYQRPRSLVVAPGADPTNSGTIAADKFLYGHPSGRPYRSPKEFLSHLEWLEGGMVGHCDCKLCNVRPTAASASPSGSRAGTASATGASPSPSASDLRAGTATTKPAAMLRRLSHRPTSASDDGSQSPSALALAAATHAADVASAAMFAATAAANTAVANAAAAVAASGTTAGRSVARNHSTTSLGSGGNSDNDGGAPGPADGEAPPPKRMRIAAGAGLHLQQQQQQQQRQQQQQQHRVPAWSPQVQLPPGDIPIQLSTGPAAFSTRFTADRPSPLNALHPPLSVGLGLVLSDSPPPSPTDWVVQYPRTAVPVPRSKRIEVLPGKRLGPKDMFPTVPPLPSASLRYRHPSLMLPPLSPPPPQQSLDPFAPMPFGLEHLFMPPTFAPFRDACDEMGLPSPPPSEPVIIKPPPSMRASSRPASPTVKGKVGRPPSSSTAGVMGTSRTSLAAKSPRNARTAESDPATIAPSALLAPVRPISPPLSAESTTGVTTRRHHLHHGETAAVPHILHSDGSVMSAAASNFTAAAAIAAAADAAARASVTGRGGSSSAAASAGAATYATLAAGDMATDVALEAAAGGDDEYVAIQVAVRGNERRARREALVRRRARVALAARGGHADGALTAAAAAVSSIMDGGVEADDDDMDIDSISHQRQRQPESGAASPEDVAAVAAAIAKLPPRPASTGPRPSMLSSLQTPKMGMSASSTTSLLSDVSSLAYRPLPTPAPPADRNEWHGMQVCWLKVRAGDPIGWQIDYDIYDHRSRYRATWNELVIGNPDADLPDSSDSSAVGDDGSTSSNDRDSSEDRSSDTGNDSDVSLPGIVTPCRRRSTADPGPVKLRNSISGDGMSVRRGPKRQYPHCDRSLPLPQRETTYPAGANETPLHLLGRRRHRRAVRWPVMIVARAPRGMPHLAAMLGPGETVPSPSLCPVPGTAEAEIAGDPSTWEYSVVKLPLGRHYAEWLVGGREGVREAAVLQAEAATGARDALPLMPTMDLYTFIASLAVASLASSPVGSGDINAFKTAADPALRVCNVPNQPDHVDLLVSGRPATSVGRPTFAPATVALHPDHVQPFVHGARPRDLRAWRAAPMAMPPRRAPLYMSAVVQATAIAASWEDIARIPVSAPSDLVPPPPLFPVAPPPTTASVAKHRTTLADAETQAAAGQAVVRIGTEVFRPGAHVWQIPMRIRTTKDNKLHKGAIKAAVTAAARAGHHTVRRLVVEADGGENGDADGLPPGLHPLVLGAYALGAASDDPVALPGGTRPPDRQIAVYTHNPLMSVSFASTTTGATGTAASTETASDLDAVLLTRMDPEAVTSVFSGYGPRGTRYRSLAHLATF